MEVIFDIRGGAAVTRDMPVPPRKHEVVVLNGDHYAIDTVLWLDGGEGRDPTVRIEVSGTNRP